jgi:hypothetical protein
MFTTMQSTNIFIWISKLFFLFIAEPKVLPLVTHKNCSKIRTSSGTLQHQEQLNVNNG